MRQITITELSEGEIEAIGGYLAKNFEPGALAGVFWIPLPDGCLDKAQQGHEKCGPFVFPVELCRDSVVFELLVRSSSNLHCSCTAYATVEQRKFLLGHLDAMVEELHIKA